MPDLIVYEMSVGLLGLVLSITALIFLRHMSWPWKEREVFYNFTAALTLFSIGMMLEPIEQSWNLVNFYGYKLPSVLIILETATLLYFAVGLWNYLDLEGQE